MASAAFPRDIEGANDGGTGDHWKMLAVYDDGDNEGTRVGAWLVKGGDWSS